MQQQIRKFRPWFDDSFRNLTILRKITEAFPEEGDVTAKTLEIRDLSWPDVHDVGAQPAGFSDQLSHRRSIGWRIAAQIETPAAEFRP